MKKILLDNKNILRRKTIRSQVWVETAIYTLIGLTLIAIVLSATIPQIQKLKDRGILTQTTNSLTDLHKELLSVSEATGNVRVFYFQLNKGGLEINPISDTITYSLENTNLKYSEPGKSITYSDITYVTVPYGSRYTVSLQLNYSSLIDITYQNGNDLKVLHNGIYKLRIESRGRSQSGKIQLDFDVL